MITSGSPTEQFEICVSGAYFRGIWFPECEGHVTDRHTKQQREARAVGRRAQALPDRPWHAIEAATKEMVEKIE